MKDPGSYANPINSSFQKFRTTKLKPRWDVHLSGDDDQLGLSP